MSSAVSNIGSISVVNRFPRKDIDYLYRFSKDKSHQNYSLILPHRK